MPLIDIMIGPQHEHMGSKDDVSTDDVYTSPYAISFSKRNTEHIKRTRSTGLTHTHG